MTGRWTGRWRKATGRSDQEARQQQQRPDTGPDVGQQRPIEYREVPEQRNCDQTRPVACDRMPSVFDQLMHALTVGTTGRIRSGRDQRPVSSRKAGFRPQRLLSQWGL